MLQRRIVLLRLDGRLALPILRLGVIRTHFSRTPGRCHVNAFIHPRFRVVLLLFQVPAAKQTVQVFGVPEVFADNRRGVGVVFYVLLKVAITLQNVVDNSTQERYVRSGADGYVQIRDSAGPGESWIDVDDSSATLARLHHPAKRHWMAFRHVRPFNNDDVRVD
jgi:hypothetical protein